MVVTMVVMGRLQQDLSFSWMANVILIAIMQQSSRQNSMVGRTSSLKVQIFSMFLVSTNFVDSI